MFELQGDISGEQPWTASSWNEKPWNHICKLAGGRFKVDGCAFGLKDVVSGKLMHKSWGFFSSHPGVKRRLGKTCNHAPHDHVRIEGRLTALSAVYPRKLCDAFAKGLFDRTVEFTAFSLDVAHLCAKETHFEKCAGIFASRSAQSDARPGEEQDDGENKEEGEAIDGERKGRDEQGEEPEEDLTPEEVTKLKLVHRNLQHPSSAVLIRAMKHAGVAERFIHAAKRFECEFCKRQALRKPVLPATLNQVQEKWQVLSIDTFWWKHPKPGPDGKERHVIGLSYLDEATDLHVASVVGESGGMPASVTGDEFRKRFVKDWLKCLPKPQVIRSDVEGCFRGPNTVSWLEDVRRTNDLCCPHCW